MSTERTSPQVREHKLLDRDDSPLEIIGAELGFASSKREIHAHPGRDFAAPGERCSACRWFEVRIFSVDEERVTDGTEPARARYLVLTYGLSEVPGEVAKRRAHWTDSQFAIIEALTQRRANSAFLPATSARVLAEAAAHDEDIADAYVNRAVA